MDEYQGWFLDVYADQKDGVVLWLLGEDGVRYSLRQKFPLFFYITGDKERLRQCWRFLKQRYSTEVDLSYIQRRDLFSSMLNVVSVEVSQPARLAKIFYDSLRSFPDLDYYDTDIPLALRFSAMHGTFPLARCQINAHQEQILSIELLDQPEDLVAEPPPVRIMSLTPDVDPGYAPPNFVKLRVGRTHQRIRVEENALFVRRMDKLIRRHDPDLILTKWGDTWLFPLLFDLAEKYNVPFNPNRDENRQVLRRKAFSYHTYGQVLHRGQQSHLFGRWHIDETNAVMYGDYNLLGVLEQARVTCLPIQETARKSPGAGITAMQIISALQKSILVPYRKQQAEDFKTPAQMICADRGGLVGQPITGLHKNVAGIDFFSMYPQLMKRFNISPETVGRHGCETAYIPGLKTPITQDEVGFVGNTLEPLLKKRFVLKQAIAKLDRQDYRYPLLKARASALKWLLVVCFGYLGHKHFRWMRVEAYEAVTGFGREILLTAKDVAEEFGFQVLSFNVDGLYVKKEGAVTAEDFQPLLDEIYKRTDMPIALDGLFRWLAFLPSRADPRIPVANRYFGVFQDGRIKVRGIEMRRHDTPPFIYQAQADVLKILAEDYDRVPLDEVFSRIFDLLRERVFALRAGAIPIEELLVTQRLSRLPAEYKQPSPGARAALQLNALGKDMQPGQKIQFLYTRTKPKVSAWQAGEPLEIETVDVEQYVRLTVRAVGNVLQSFGLNESLIRDQLAGYRIMFPYEWFVEEEVFVVMG